MTLAVRPLRRRRSMRMLTPVNPKPHDSQQAHDPDGTTELDRTAGSEASVALIITGGTFDKAYDSIRGELTLSKTHLPDILAMVGCTVSVRPVVETLKDSLEMTDEDRAVIAAACADAPEQQVIVTHGTDTMTETARVLREAELGKTIVFTGAMVPFAVNGSDALFNLGGAFAAVQTLPAGVYVVMNGRVFRSDRVRKNRSSGVFEAIDGDA